MKKRICIVSFSTIRRDARVLREVQYLNSNYDLLVIGFGGLPQGFSGNSSIRWNAIKPFPPHFFTRAKGWLTLGLIGWILPKFYESWYWGKPVYQEALRIMLENKCHLIHANDWDALPVAAEAARITGAKLVFDAHEYSPLMFEDVFFWRWLYSRPIQYFFRRYFPAIDAAITVAPRIADRYREEWGLNPVVVLNAPDYVHLPKKVHLLTDELHLVHHGGANPSRRLELMIEAIGSCRPGIYMHLMLVNGDSKYVRKLETLAEKVAPGKVTFLQPVSPSQIPEEISQFDIGVYLLKPSNFNQRVALPNKFFDFLQAGLAVCIGPSPSMADIVNEYGCGWVVPTFQPKDMAEVINQIDCNELMEKQQAAQEAALNFNAKIEMGKVLDIYQELLS